MDKLIVFAPGYSGLPRHWYNPLLKRFKNKGIDVLSLEYDLAGTGSITDTALKCEKIMRPLRQSYDHICFIGHSMGGLVGRAIDDSLYDSYVSLGTPHNGTWAALGGFWSQAARDMIPGSKFLADLKYGRIWNKYSLNISAQYDILVPNSFFNQDVEDLTIPNTTHVSLLWSKRTFYEIYSWLIYEVLNETGLTSKDEGHEAKVDVKE